MKNKSTSQSVLIGLFVVLMLAASNSIVRAQCYNPTWNRATGNWDNPINWTSDCVPDISSDASINNGGSATISDPPNPSRLTHSLKIGDGQNVTGSLTVYGVTGRTIPQLNVDGGDFYIGNQGKGSLSIINGTNPTIWSHSVYIGAQSGSSGTVNVSGDGTVWQLVPSSTLFIGCTAGSVTGGTAVLNFQSPFASPTISITNYSPTIPGIKVGTSGTVNGRGTFALDGYNDVSRTAEVFGTLAPTGALAIAGNLDLTKLGANTANTIFHVTPQAHDEVYVGHSTGGLSGGVTLGGRVTVIMTGTFTVGQSFTLLHADAGRGTTKFLYQSIMFLSVPPMCQRGHQLS